jgi:hypothetical protein
MRKTLTMMLLVVAVTVVGLMAADVRLGTWKYDAKKSKTTSINPVKSQIDVREAA